jgi:FMN phosphatase YigB (HAD superfamily)
MIDDHLEADIMGASQAGWRNIHFDSTGPVKGEHHHVHSLSEVMGML